MSEFDPHQNERRAGRLRKMIERLGCDPHSLVVSRRGDDYAEAQVKCLACINTAQCLQWFDNRADEPPVFCPNLDLLKRFSRLHDTA